MTLIDIDQLDAVVCIMMHVVVYLVNSTSNIVNHLA